MRSRGLQEDAMLLQVLVEKHAPRIAVSCLLELERIPTEIYVMSACFDPRLSQEKMEWLGVDLSIVAVGWLVCLFAQFVNQRVMVQLWDLILIKYAKTHEKDYSFFTKHGLFLLYI